jgi:hypothetical protein
MYNGHVESVLKETSTQQNHWRALLKVTWRREKLKMFNIVEA